VQVVAIATWPQVASAYAVSDPAIRSSRMRLMWVTHEFVRNP
jgi:hypothetical protein